MFIYGICIRRFMAKEDREKRRGMGGLFIPAGLFIGMGLGFVYGNIPAGIFIGLGAGFAAFAIAALMRK
jgi:hypothetical protein